MNQMSDARCQMSVKALLYAGLLSLCACDWHPLYGGVSPGNHESAGVSADLSEVRVDTIADRAGQIMRNELIDRLQAEGVPPP